MSCCENKDQTTSCSENSAENKSGCKCCCKKCSIGLSVLGFLSILGSIGIWYCAGGESVDAESRAHAERFGIFVGLWAPTFFTLANKAALCSLSGFCKNQCCKK